MTREKVQRPIRKGIQELGIAPELPMPLIFSQRGYLNCISAPSLEAKQGKSLHQLPTHSVQGEASGTLRPQQLLRYTNTNTELSVLREQATSGEEIRGAGIILRKEAVRLCTRGFAQSPQISLTQQQMEQKKFVWSVSSAEVKLLMLFLCTNS